MSSRSHPSVHPVSSGTGPIARLARAASRLRPLRRGADLRVLLAAIPLLALPPLMIFCALLLSLLADARSTDARQDLQNAAQALAIGLDREIAGSIRRLETIADLAAVQPDDLTAFARAGQREIERNDEWRDLVLATPDGRVVHAVARGGRSLQPPSFVPQSHHRETLRTALPTVSDIYSPRPDGTPVASISVPVQVEGRVRWLLSARLDPQLMSRRLADQVERYGALGELIDREGRVVARSRDLAAWYGRPAGGRIAELARGAPSGTSTPFPTTEGEAVLGAWARLPFGWSVALSVPTAPGPALARSMWMLAAIGLALLAGSILLSTAIARRITGMVAEAGRAAQQVARARRPRLGAPAIRQFGVLYDALDEAGERVVDALERERCARETAEAADREKDRFLVMLGHELRNPLNAVGNAGHLLRRRDLSAGQRDGVVEMLQRQSRQLRRLVDDLLDLGRVLTGKFALRAETVEVDRLLRQSIATLGATGQLASHEVSADLEPVSCRIDPARFEQVFANLVGNAIKYTPTGGTIAVRLSRDADAMVLSVRDSGIGIEPQQLQRIFELFVQGPQQAGRAAGGLGIGLSMAKMLVEVHGGTIEARSDGPGRGTELLVRIPCAGPDAQAGASPAATQVEGRDAERTDDAPTPV